MKVGLIGVPINYGCDKDGTQYGPKKLRLNNLVETVKKTGIDIYDVGDVPIEKTNENDKFKHDENIKYYKSIYSANENLANSVCKLLNHGYFPLILGGDHSIALGSISGSSRYFKNLGVVWIDAHGDFNTEVISESKNAHGMPLALLCGYGKKDFLNLYDNGTKLKETNIFHIGGRDFDTNEEKLIKSTMINLYDKKVINTKGFKWILNDILKKCKSQNIDSLHISLDIDFLDKDLVPGTGTRVNEGYTLEDIEYILKMLVKSGFVKSMDFVEFNPLLDDNNKTLDICQKLLVYFLELF